MLALGGVATHLQLAAHPERLMRMMLAVGGTEHVQLAATSRAADADDARTGRGGHAHLQLVPAARAADGMMLMMLALHSPALLQLAATHRAADADDARSGGTTFAACNNAQSG